MFIGTLILLLATEKLVKKPKPKQPFQTCSPNQKEDNYCPSFGKINKSPKTKLTNNPRNSNPTQQNPRHPNQPARTVRKPRRSRKTRANPKNPNQQRRHSSIRLEKPTAHPQLPRNISDPQLIL
jgi:hypothetical protein